MDSIIGTASRRFSPRSVKRFGKVASVGPNRSPVNTAFSSGMKTVRLSGVDVFLVMSVNPGWGGQGFIPSVLPKLTRAVELRKERGYGYSIHIDGGIDRATAPDAVQAGAEVLVAGSAIFKSEDPRAMVGELRRVGEEVL